MSVGDLVQIAAAIFGIASAAVVLIWRRFGAPSWLLSGFLLFGAGTPGMLTLASRADSDGRLRLAITSLVLAGPCGLLFAWSVGRQDYRRALAHKRRLVAAILIPIPFLLAGLALLQPPLDASVLPKGFVSLGPGGYLASLYLLVISAMALASLEQNLRSVDEIVRWEIKFLVLGLGGVYAAVLFACSKVLLYSFSYALLPQDALRVFSFIFPLCCALILYSWRRSSGRSVIRVSQSFIYGSITLLAVGIYLISSSLIARWISQWGTPGIQIEAIVFMLAVIALAALLLTTQFRHRARLWIRRHIFGGKYDYRRYWMDATEQIRWEETPRKTAAALTRIVQNAIGAIEVSVWLRQWNPNRLELPLPVG